MTELSCVVTERSTSGAIETEAGITEGKPDMYVEGYKTGTTSMERLITIRGFPNATKQICVAMFEFVVGHDAWNEPVAYEPIVPSES
jgi:hypothetical protein